MVRRAKVTFEIRRNVICVYTMHNSKQSPFFSFISLFIPSHINKSKSFCKLSYGIKERSDFLNSFKRTPLSAAFATTLTARFLSSLVHVCSLSPTKFLWCLLKRGLSLLLYPYTCLKFKLKKRMFIFSWVDLNVFNGWSDIRISVTSWQVVMANDRFCTWQPSMAR